jgi:FkbM family methyltransferase
MNISDYKQFIKDTGTLIQIGAFDGVACEDSGFRELVLYKNYNAHLVEPVIDFFQALQKNYSNATSNVRFYNQAIYTENGELPFFKNYTDPLQCTFIRENVAEYHGQTILVQSRTFDTFLQENNINEIEGLFIDAEGAEDTILQQLFEKTNIRPNIIRYEWPHLPDPVNTIRYIMSYGYTVSPCIYSGGRVDNICIKNDLLV